MPGGAQPSGVSAIVLAAGMSRRMGVPKQLIPLGGKSLLETVLDNLRESRVDEIVLVLGHAADTIRQQVALDGVRAVANEAYREGMGTSLGAGISQVGPRAEAALVVLADQPFVRPGTINRLIDEYREHRPQIAIPVYRGFRGNPVVLDRSVFPEIMGLNGDIGCRAIFGSHSENIRKVPVDDIGVLLDVDTKEDFERFGERPALPETADLEGGEIDATAPQLVVVGGEAVAQALVKLGHLMRFTVTVVDPLLGIRDLPGADRVLHALDFSRLPAARGIYVVAASRRFDEEAIEQALAADAAYIALVSSKTRAQEILASLQARGVAPERLARVRAPAGLGIGAETAEEIALSVMAEIVAERRAKSAAASAPSRSRNS
jgi:molybdenum cofactor cytidylyltransferase